MLLFHLESICAPTGLVGITSGCAVVQAYAAVVIGIVAAIIWLFSSRALRGLGIDDPLDAAPVHFFCGIWGVLAVRYTLLKHAFLSQL